MAYQQIHLPDGSIAEFPDDMPDSEIQKVLDQEFAATGAAKAPETNTAQDILDSALYRGAPEAMAAMTPIGMAGNIVGGVADLVRWGAHKGANAIGYDLPYADVNPVPSSHDMLQASSKALLGQDLYEPKTTPGEYANTLMQFGLGGKLAGASLKTTIPAALVSETAGQATKGTEAEPYARLGGALVGGVGANALRNAFTKKPAITSAAVKQVANQKYAEVEKMGVQMPAEVTNKYINSVKSTLLSDDEVINSMKSSQPLRDAYDDIALFKDQPMTLTRAQALDEQIGNMIDSHTTLGQVNKVGKKLLDAQAQLRQVVDENFSSPALKEARKAWSDQAKLRDVERIMTRAETMDNPATGIKTGFRQLLTNPNKSKWYTKEELKIIEKAATSGIPGDILRTMGSRLIPIIDAGTGGGLASTVVSSGGAMAARNMATQAQVNRAMKLSDSIANKYGSPRVGANAQMMRSIDQKQVFPGLLGNYSLPNPIRKGMGLLGR